MSQTKSSTDHLCSIFASKPFTFIVQGVPLYVHAALIADCSAPLDRMINGHLSEAIQGFALLNDVDEGTFVRFIRWTYTKDYTAAEYTWAEIGEEPVGSETETAQKEAPQWDAIDSWERWGTSVKVKKKDKKSSSKLHTSLKESFICEYDCWSPDATPELRSTPGPRSNLHPQEDYTEVFLSHACLYVFAEKYDIQPLKKQCHQKLKHTLAIYTLYPERVGDITTLLKYVYANTAETISGTEDIRTMLAHYVGTEMDTLIKYGEIKDLMLGNGDLLGDFLKMFALNIS